MFHPRFYLYSSIVGNPEYLQNDERPGTDAQPDLGMFDQRVAKIIKRSQKAIVETFKFHAGDEKKYQGKQVSLSKHQIARNVACLVLTEITNELCQNKISGMQAKQMLFPPKPSNEIDDDDPSGVSSDEEGNMEEVESSEEEATLTQDKTQRIQKTPQALKNFEKGKLVRRRNQN